MKISINSRQETGEERLEVAWWRHISAGTRSYFITPIPQENLSTGREKNEGLQLQRLVDHNARYLLVETLWLPRQPAG